jgi:hypothetical protein
MTKEKKTPKELVKYHNELNYARFGDFTPIEMDIFFAIISRMRDSHGTESTLTLRGLREITGYSQRGDKKLSF